jgi:1,4-dihydroxy-2-naphthoate octaprenyltransferase
MSGTFRAVPAVLCLLFAILAQIASNFANEYYDYRDGVDKVGRDGPRRGVTEGDITPRAMLIATFGVLAVAGVIGCSLIYWGGWWLLPVGLLIALGVIAYSTGPYPLSRHCMGEAAVILFFGIVPVNLTYYVQALEFTTPVSLASLAIGLMGANVIIINNYRDADDDAAVGKNTLANVYGRKTVSMLYLLDGIVAAALLFWQDLHICWALVVYLILHVTLWNFLRGHRGAALNPLLGMTSTLMLLVALVLLIHAILL